MILGVFDGHGPTQHGHLVAELCVSRFVALAKERFWQQRDAPVEKIQAGLYDVVHALDAEAEALSDSARVFAGTTLCVVVIRDGFFWVVNVGDSRAVMGTRKLGRFQSVEQLTVDHTVFEERERRRIEENGGWIAAGRLNGDLAMSRTIGDIEFKKYRNHASLHKRNEMHNRHFGEELLVCTPDIERRAISESFVMVLATDGVWVTLDNRTVAKIAGQGNADNAAKKVADLAIREGSVDNIAVIIVRYEWDQEKEMEIEGQERGRRRKAMLRMWRRAKGRLLEKEDTMHGGRLYEQMDDEHESSTGSGE